jgi:D-xylose transport system ATP-binding protein
MQMVEIAKALSENAKILILDEPTSALTESEIDKLMEILENLRSHGVTCIYITHKLDEFFRITDSVTILRDGKTVTTQPTSQLTQEKLVSYMVGREMKERFPRGQRKPGEVMFEVTNLQAVDPERDQPQSARRCQLQLAAGRNPGHRRADGLGSHRTGHDDLWRVRQDHGRQHQTGGAGNSRQRRARRHAPGHQPGARGSQGSGAGADAVDPQEYFAGQPGSVLWLHAHRRRRRIGGGCTTGKGMAVKAPNLQVRVDSLSGGNQQKVVIAKWLLSNPKILIMDDPTRGIDVGAKYEIYKLMNDLAERGVSIIMISSELEEVLGHERPHHGDARRALDAYARDWRSLARADHGAGDRHC